jgi:osmoprotectant transport system permease protein
MRLFEFWASHGTELAALVTRHVLLVVSSTLVAIAAGVPLGILAAHRPRIGRPVIAVANIAQTIPSLALLGFLLPLPLVGGVGPRVAIAALILYALLPIVRGTAAGLASIDPAVLEAARAMGMTPRQLLRIVELPLALPSIVGGIRVATVVGVGTATVAAAIGAGGLGEYIFRGLSMVDSSIILAGAIPAALLALLFDALLTLAERQLQPSRGGAGNRRAFAAGALMLLVAVGAAALAARDDEGAVVVGSKNFTEQIILGEILAQALESEGVPVVRKLNLGGTFICDSALRSGDIDMYVEYSGTALTAIFKAPVPKRGDASANRTAVLDAIKTRYAEAGITVAAPLGFNNTFAILVRRADAERHALRTIGDLSRVAASFTPGFGYEFVEREDGYRGLTAAYSLRFAESPRVMDLTLIYRALAGDEIDVTAGDATSGLIHSLNLTMLEDDRGYFPPYDAVPVVGTAALVGNPAVQRALDRMAGRISEADMREMNYAVDVEKQDVSAIARRWLQQR